MIRSSRTPEPTYPSYLNEVRASNSVIQVKRTGCRSRLALPYRTDILPASSLVLETLKIDVQHAFRSAECFSDRHLVSTP